METKVTIIKFYANWCEPCKLLQPTFERIKEEYPQFEFKQYDIDTQEGAKHTHDYGIRSVPTIVIHKEDGEEVDFNILIGNISYKQLKEEVENYL